MRSAAALVAMNIQSVPYRQGRGGRPRPAVCSALSVQLSLVARGFCGLPAGLWESDQDVLDALPRVAEQHAAVVPEEQRVLHAGVAGVHRALEDDDLPGLPDLEDGHAGDGA